VPYELEFYDDGNGREPVRRWLDSLSEDKRAAAMRGLSLVLAEQAQGSLTRSTARHSATASTSFGFATAPRRSSKGSAPSWPTGSVRSPTTRCCCGCSSTHTGDRLVLLLGGCDKGKDPSRRRQRKEIDLARGRLKTWRGRQRRGDGHTGRFRGWWISQVRRRP
jgi:hypothetical protein